LDTNETSLLVAMIEVLSDYAADHSIGEALYKPFLERLEVTDNLVY